MVYKAVVGAQIDGQLKHDALRILDKLDITMSQAIRLFFDAIIAYDGMPFKCDGLSQKKARLGPCACEKTKDECHG